MITDYTFNNFITVKVVIVKSVPYQNGPLSFQYESLVIVLSSGAWALLEVIMLQPRYLRTQSSDLYESI